MVLRVSPSKAGELKEGQDKGKSNIERTNEELINRSAIMRVK